MPRENDPPRLQINGTSAALKFQTIICIAYEMSEVDEIAQLYVESLAHAHGRFCRFLPPA